MSLPKLKLTYYGLPARAECIRLALTISGIPFEDHRIDGEEFAELRNTFPLKSIPVMEMTRVEGEEPIIMCQSTAMLQYVGKLGNLYPTDPLRAFYVDQIVHTIWDLFDNIFMYRGSDEEEKRKARENAIKVGGERYFGGCERMIRNIPGSDDGPYVLGEQISIADCMITMAYNFFAVSFLDYVPTDALHEYKRMLSIREAVMERPEVKKYYEKNPLCKSPISK